MSDLFDMLVPAKIEKEEKKKTPAKKENKKQEKPVNETKESHEKYKFPFAIYLAAEKKDVSHIFEEGKKYSASEITKAMLKHGFYEFSGNVHYDFVEEDNVLVPIFQQHKKG